MKNLCLLLIALMALAAVTAGQDAREALGPRDRPRAAGPHPLEKLMAERRSALRPELRGMHPRVFVTDQGLAELRQRARTTHRAIWQRALAGLRVHRGDPPAPPAQARRAQNEVGLAIAEAALAYRIEGRPELLAAARRYMDAAVSYDIWGYAYNKPNVDLAAGHLLYGLGWGYDLLYHELPDADRARYRAKLARHAQLLADYYKPKPGRTYSYSQNHVFIPMSGLGVAAYALYDEVPEAAQWARLARAIMDRVLATYTPDGYYYEGFEYWVFSTPWLLLYLDAHRHATGEDLFDQPGIRQMHWYLAHSLLPDGQHIFDFGDAFQGPLTRAGQGEDYRRTHPGGKLHSNFNLLYRVASRFQSAEAQGVAAWMQSLGHVSFFDVWSLLWYDPKVSAAPPSIWPRWHYFRDHEVVYWRSDWTPQATAFAFKCGPPEGHHALAGLRAFPDWHLSMGHAHPDAGSFIIYAGGRYLTGDSGYAGVPLTAHHNTVLVDGRGQVREGRGHDAFDGVPYERLDRLEITDVRLSRDSAYIRANVAAAYEGLTAFERVFVYSHGFVVEDTFASPDPRVFTALIHGDTQPPKVEILYPADARTEVQPNLLTAAGQPGSVDKGERQQRGTRLAISTGRPVREASIILRLSIVR